MIGRAEPDRAPQALLRPRRRWPVFCWIGLAGIGVAWFMTMAPPVEEFVFAVTAAVCWCVWLEDHETSDES